MHNQIAIPDPMLEQLAQATGAQDPVGNWLENGAYPDDQVNATEDVLQHVRGRLVMPCSDEEWDA